MVSELKFTGIIISATASFIGSPLDMDGDQQSAKQRDDFKLRLLLNSVSLHNPGFQSLKERFSRLYDQKGGQGAAVY